MSFSFVSLACRAKVIVLVGNKWTADALSEIGVSTTGAAARTMLHEQTRLGSLVGSRRELGTQSSKACIMSDEPMIISPCSRQEVLGEIDAQSFCLI